MKGYQSKQGSLAMLEMGVDKEVYSLCLGQMSLPKALTASKLMGMVELSLSSEMRKAEWRKRPWFLGEKKGRVSG
jgi:hypothetical protein